MALLTKKIKASTLMETLVATVLIVVVFMVASMVLNTLFASSIRQNESQIRQELLWLQYQHKNGMLEIPYQNEFNSWKVQVTEIKFNNESHIEFIAAKEGTDRKMKYKISDD